MIRIYFLLALVSINFCPAAFAQTACPVGVAPGSPQCGPDSGTSRGDASNPPPPRPTGEWIKTWGAIAGSDNTGEVGTTVGKLSESDAKQAAIRQCALGGADDCRVDLVYHNQCAAFAISQSETFFQASPTEQRAINLVKKVCEESNSGSCKVRYSGCSEPIFKKY
ncbi:DUF4189 domain-containing protein [Xanthomonas campestris]|uniref:DUF4189 domain-containing protein n=1 Tax=Xanthomonas campestris TaxID=339 RepID=UPI0023784BD4|nr:DUF4189 domain-containing protein [Xanthomonas campestris]WDK02767.1 DUF4189 domain-containing protein [Xanthomonas campestris]